LAGLAGLAYAMRKKGDSSTTDTGDETERLKARKPAEEEKRRQITDYIKKAPEDEKGSAQSDVLKTVTSPKAASNDKAGNQGVLPQKSLTPEVKPKALSEPAVDNTTAAAIPSGIMGGARQQTSTVSSSAEGMKNYKPRRTPPSARSPGDEMSETAKKYKRPTLMKEGGMTASSRADGIATKGKTRGKIC
jgi:hypothetical protein